MNDKLVVKTCNVTQHGTGANKSDWIIKANGQKGEKLGILPKKLNESEVFAVLRMFRPYEQKAFDLGIVEGQGLLKRKYDQEVATFTTKINLAAKENARLAELLEKEQLKNTPK